LWCEASAVIFIFNLVVAPLPALAEDVTPAQAASGLYQADQAWLHRIVPHVAIGGQSDTLSAYAAKCKDATGIDVPGHRTRL
ncbi:MAG: hypothetical protein ACREI9_16755, partial [Nitrospiraceae bacterium]